MKTKAIIFLLLFAFLCAASTSFAITPNAKNSADAIRTGDDKFDKVFREGREMIDAEKWKEAAAKFNEIVCDCPDKKGVDAAFYWLAFAYKKQKMFTEMNVAINSLLKNFPNSSWADDARVLRLQNFPSGIATTAQGERVLEVFSGLNIASSSSNTTLDREEEVKLAAFQSLYSAEPKRAIEILGERLSPNSGTSENLQIQMLRSIRNSVSSRYYSYSSSPLRVVTGQAVTTGTNNQNSDANRAEITLKLREVLTRSYEKATNVKIKKEILSFFGGSEESSNFLVRIYSSESDKEIKKSIIRALGGSLYSPVYLATNPNTLQKSNFDRLLEIYRNEKDSELKIAALNALQSFKGWSENETILQALSQTYDNETDEKSKVSVINLLGQLGNAKGEAKLMEIVRNDKSDKMRLEAIRALRGSRNPEVIRFLEDLIK